MTAQAVIAEVQHQVGSAAVAVRSPAAGGAGEHRRIAAAIEKEQALLATRQALFDRLQQGAGEPVLQLVDARVNAPDRRQPRAFDRALAQLQQAVAAAAGLRRGIGPAFERRRRRAENDRNGPLPGTEDGEIARRIANSVLLFERGIVLLVDDDQAQLGQRREDRQASAENDPRFTGQRRPPVATPRRVAQLAVQTDHAGGRKTRRNAPLELWCEIDFGDQQQRLASAGERTLDQAQIDFGLAAASDAVQQISAETACEVADRGQRRVLPAGQFGRRLRGSVHDRLARLADLRRADRTQAGRQRRQHYLTGRRVVVSGTEFGQAKPVAGQRRQIAENRSERSQLFRRQLADRRQFDQDADFLLGAKGHTHTVADVGRRQGLAVGNTIVEETAKWNIERDAGNLRQGHRGWQPFGCC